MSLSVSSLSADNSVLIDGQASPASDGASSTSVAPAVDPDTIPVYFLSGKKLSVNFNPDEFVWHFSKRMGDYALAPLDVYRVSNTMRFLWNKVPINTFSNRLARMGDLVSDPTKGLHATPWELSRVPRHIWIGNASPDLDDRSICRMCFKSIEAYKSVEAKPVEKDLLGVVLQCSHAFHESCLQQHIHRAQARATCPICSRRIVDFL